MQDGLLTRAAPLFAGLFLVAAGCGSGEAKVEQDTASVRRLGAGEGESVDARVQAIQNSPLPDDVKAKKIAALRGGG